MRFAGDTEFTLDTNYNPGHLCVTCDDCVLNWCEGSINNPPRCGMTEPTSDGWYGGGDEPGCGPDPSSEYRDYYFDINGMEQFELIETFNCDELDDCIGPEITDYYVIENTNEVGYETWLDADPLSPLLITPDDGIDFILGEDIHFSWEPAPDTAPTGYFFRVYRNGEVFDEYGADPVYGFYFGPAEFYDLISDITEIVARDGLWEWEVGAHYGEDKYEDIHWSDKRILHKHTAGVLQSPDDGSDISLDELYDWDPVTGATNYVAKITGLLPMNIPYYLPLMSDDTDFILEQPYYDMLKSGDYTWAVAATTYMGDNPAKHAMLSYTDPPWSFTK